MTQPTTQTARTPYPEAADTAASRIAPTWPLDRFIAVNPLWGWTDQPVEAATAAVQRLRGTRFLMPREWYAKKYLSGAFTKADLDAALQELGRSQHADQVLRMLAAPTRTPRRASLITDLLDESRDSGHQLLWAEYLPHSLSQFLARYFQDRGAASRKEPTGLYDAWKRSAWHDRSPKILLGLQDFRARLKGLPQDPADALQEALDQLGVPENLHADYLTALLLDIGGWAAWCAYEKWTANLDGRDDDHILELLAIRISWERILYDTHPVQAQWTDALSQWRQATPDSWSLEWAPQRALERAYRRRLLDAIRSPAPASRTRNAPPHPTERPRIQAAFCIDVRSEVFRRHLEHREDLETIGFAGFFGLPASHQPLGSNVVEPHLPGLLAPQVQVTDTGSEGLASKRRARLRSRLTMARIQKGALGGFAFVEALGPLYGPKLLTDAFGATRPTVDPARAGLHRHELEHVQPVRLTNNDGSPLALEARTRLAAGILRGMGIAKRHAQLVALIGHGSQTANNPHRAGYDCGACCGQTGEVNARATAALLNDPEVRAALPSQGIDLAPDTRFVAGLHNTTTDEVLLEPLGDATSGDQERYAQLQTALVTAGQQTRAERAERLGLQGLDDTKLERATKQRARDWSQVRPEWGLAGNAAFIAAPRARTRGKDLQGRTFLHDYNFREDEGQGLLELIMTAPMVVAHWINFQYYASTVANDHYGSGNKVLHNVVGYNLGVYEGNYGDLRIGLPMQALHDGTDWIHEPLRLQVLIEAPQDAIDAILAKHDAVRNLVENGWIDLLQMELDGGALSRRTVEGWARIHEA